jgi:hypothetical protein
MDAAIQMKHWRPKNQSKKKPAHHEQRVADGWSYCKAEAD